MKTSGVVSYCVDQMLSTKKKPLLVGVIGDSGSGKSYFSERIQAELHRRGMSFTCINHDEFLIARKDRPALKEKTYTKGEHAGKTYWEVLENWSRLREFQRVINDLRAGKASTFFPYERTSGEVSKTEREVPPADIILFDTSLLVEEMDFTIMVDVDIETVIERKLMRDADIRHPGEIIKMHRTVQGSHWQRAKPQGADIIIDNNDIREPLIVYPLGETRLPQTIPPGKYRAVLFDMDGTIINNMPYDFYSWITFARRHGVELTKDDFVEQYAARPSSYIMERILNRELKEMELQQLYAERQEMYWESMQRYIRTIRGFESWVKDIKNQGLPVGIVTSSSAPMRQRLLDQLGIADMFDLTVSAEDVANTKPHPEPYLKAAGLLGVSPGSCLVFEDSPTGIKAAKAAGMTVVGVVSTHTLEQLHQADMLINTYEDITFGGEKVG